MLGHFNSFVLPSDMRSIKMSQLQLCAYNLFHFTLCFGEGYWISLPGCGMNLLLLAHTQKTFHSLLDLQPIEVTRKTSIDSSGAGSSSRKADKCYLVLVNIKKESKRELLKPGLLLSVKKMSTYNLFKARKVSSTNNWGVITKKTFFLTVFFFSCFLILTLSHCTLFAASFLCYFTGSQTCHSGVLFTLYK